MYFFVSCPPVSDPLIYADPIGSPPSITPFKKCRMCDTGFVCFSIRQCNSSMNMQPVSYAMKYFVYCFSIKCTRLWIAGGLNTHLLYLHVHSYCVHGNTCSNQFSSKTGLKKNLVVARTYIFVKMFFLNKISFHW